jgi:hypothetical protein
MIPSRREITSSIFVKGLAAVFLKVLGKGPRPLPIYRSGNAFMTVAGSINYEQAWGDTWIIPSTKEVVPALSQLF